MNKKNLMLQLITLAIVLTQSTLALAHPGHDHSSPNSELIHALAFLPALLFVVFISYYFVALKIKKHNRDSNNDI